MRGHNLVPLQVLVEGMDDRKLIKLILKKCFDVDLEENNIIEYAQQKKGFIYGVLVSANNNSMQTIILSDEDKESTIISRTTSSTSTEKLINDENIFVVKKEIESWYLAGTNTTKIGIQIKTPPDETDTITKENFEDLISNDIILNDFKNEILNTFDTELAQKRNKSFKKFYKVFAEHIHKKLL